MVVFVFVLVRVRAKDKAAQFLGTCLHPSCLAQQESPQAIAHPKHLWVCAPGSKCESCESMSFEFWNEGGEGVMMEQNRADG